VLGVEQNDRRVVMISNFIIKFLGTLKCKQDHSIVLQLIVGLCLEYNRMRTMVVFKATFNNISVLLWI